MILQVGLNEAQQRLPELVKRLTSGDEVIITDQDRPVARLVRQRPDLPQDRRPGSARGRLRILAEDDDHPDPTHLGGSSLLKQPGTGD